MTYAIRPNPDYPIRPELSCRNCNTEIEAYGKDISGAYVWRHVWTKDTGCPPVVAYRACPQDVSAARATVDSIRDGA